jgi:hypothetical protein
MNRTECTRQTCKLSGEPIPARVYIPSAHPETREQGWLVENTNPGPTRWLSVVEGILHWTTDSNAAVRFSRKEDAQQVAGLNRFNDTAIATEHIWYS